MTRSGNYVYILRDGETWKGYLETFGGSSPLLNELLLTAASLSEAVAQAEARGYVVANVIPAR